MGKLDYKKILGPLYKCSSIEAEFIDVPELLYTMIDGEGDPNTNPEFQRDIEALYSLSYALKFQIKRRDPAQDYVVMPLEGLWWTFDNSPFDLVNRLNWKWTLMILQPSWVTEAQFEEARRDAFGKKKLDIIQNIRIERWGEGLCAQILHQGPYSTESETLAILHQTLSERGFCPNGKHHEIYLSDPRRVSPENYRTILRQPIRPASV